jgi:hypothetical protein
MAEWYLQGKPKYSEKTCPVPLCPPQNPHGLTRARTRASAVRGQRLTAWAYRTDIVTPLLSLLCTPLTFLAYFSHLMSLLKPAGTVTWGCRRDNARVGDRCIEGRTLKGYWGTKRGVQTWKFCRSWPNRELPWVIALLLTTGERLVKTRTATK